MRGFTRRGLLGAAAAAVLARPGLAQGRTVVDSAGRRVQIPARIDRVFAAGPPASVLLYALAPEMMIGWVRAPRPEETPFLLPAVRDLPETGRLNGRGGTVNLEKLVAARPDLVLDFGSVTDTYVSLADRVQAQTGLPCILVDGRFAATPASVRLIAGVLRREERGAALAAYAEATFAAVDRVVSRIPADRRPRVYLARGREGLETGSRGSINTEIIERAGAINVVDGLREPGGIVNASLEQVLAWDPGVIVTLDRNFFETAHTKVGWSRVRAVAEKRMFLAPNLPYGWIDAPPSLNRLIGLRWLLRVLYPAEDDTDLGREARDFYRLFYGAALTDTDLARLLDGAVAR